LQNYFDFPASRRASERSLQVEPQFSVFKFIRHQLCIRGGKKKWRLHAVLLHFRTKFEIVAQSIAEKRDETPENQ